MNDAVAMTTGSTKPVDLGGEQIIIREHPASFAGMPNINTVEGNGAVPAGI